MERINLEDLGNTAAQERTRQLFAKDYQVLSGALFGMEIKRVDENGQVTHHVRVARAEGYNRDTNKSRIYNQMWDMNPGDFWANPGHPARPTINMLVVAMDGDQVGACVRITGLDVRSGETFTPSRAKNNRELAEVVMGLVSGEVGRLQFIDGDDALYLVGGKFRENAPANADNDGGALGALFQ